jgi:hypothetical protein
MLGRYLENLNIKLDITFHIDQIPGILIYEVIS